MSEEQKKLYCIYCGEEIQGPTRLSAHRACIDAYGLDYNPKSEQDAIDFLERRRKFIEEDLNHGKEV